MKIFIDTNIMFSSMLFPDSTPAKAILKAVSLPNTAITSNYCINELDRSFLEKFPNKIETLNNFHLFIFAYMEIVNESENVSELEELVSDPEDRPVLRAALECNADVLITGDKHFLESRITSLEIISASDFLNSK